MKHKMSDFSRPTPHAQSTDGIRHSVIPDALKDNDNLAVGVFIVVSQLPLLNSFHEFRQFR
jgi:hypothetical protein